MPETPPHTRGNRVAGPWERTAQHSQGVNFVPPKMDQTVLKEGHLTKCGGYRKSKMIKYFIYFQTGKGDGSLWIKSALFIPDHR
jgi:hypothetical protein